MVISEKIYRNAVEKLTVRVSEEVDGNNRVHYSVQILNEFDGVITRVQSKHNDIGLNYIFNKKKYKWNCMDVGNGKVMYFQLLKYKSSTALLLFSSLCGDLEHLGYEESRIKTCV